jgi:RimJ/RimL family protein N-acetyltransferase
LWELFYTVVPGPKSIESYLDRAERERGWGRIMPFVVIEKVSGDIVGATRYMRMNAPHRRLEIGTTFYASRVQRTPINSEAKLLLLTHAFEAMDCVCVQFRTDHFNFASQRAIERLGAKRDGLIRNHQILDGRVRDTVLYSILANEWEGVKRNLQMRLARG